MELLHYLSPLTTTVKEKKKKNGEGRAVKSYPAKTTVDKSKELLHAEAYLSDTGERY